MKSFYAWKKLESETVEEYFQKERDHHEDYHKVTGTLLAILPDHSTAVRFFGGLEVTLPNEYTHHFDELLRKARDERMQVTIGFCAKGQTNKGIIEYLHFEDGSETYLN